MTDEYSVFDGFTAKVAKVRVDLGYFYKAIGAYFIFCKEHYSTLHIVEER